MAEGFLGRWSRRKAGKDETLPEEKQQAISQESSANLPVENTPQEAPPPPTLEDVEKIDRFAPDFSAFMKPDVDPVVQQAALKKMFTDPHFNIMDGLDIYIDDYSKPDPLPPGMLERMAQSDMLNLFRKSSEVLVSDGNAAASNPQADTSSLASPQQSDLTSTQQLPSTSDEVSSEVPAPQEQKKPKKIAHESKISL